MNAEIKKMALEVGFDACGITAAEELTDDAVFLRKWLAESNHGAMRYLERNFEKRTNPRLLVPDCKSVVVVLLNYYNKIQQPHDAPKIARYAHSAIDYHAVIQQKLTQLENKIIEQYSETIVNKAYQHSFTDSAPVLERRLAERAGLGWLGRNTCLVANDVGTFCFIGCLMLNAEMEYDTPVKNRCGACRKCENACPVQALKGGTLDARRCISYQTIENKEFVTEEFRPLLSGYAVGCEICAEVCPWNKKWAKPHSHSELQPTPELALWTKSDWQNLTKEQFYQTFKNSAIRRLKFEKLKDNIKNSTKL
ncbi:MAG: tRNA epoxyqueuosine(34) reductase QueG [Paludibacter sp.]|jgi:epoxyqueuosine reductase|nr:tRNA epoxyqueuosine(34) reductase QueG [Paludibacter sp.]